jgi:thymidylate kinase
MSETGEQAASRPVAITLVRDLCAALAADEIRYCHFKSNTFLDRTRAGENDLDLLVDPADAAGFARILTGLGFRRASRPDGGLPGVSDYYAYDGEAARVVHVHAHEQLIVGDDLTKNYVLPSEPYLREARSDGEFRIPPPELELILLVIRLAIKHLTWDAVVTRRHRIPRSARAELSDLESRADEAEVERYLAGWLPFVSPETLAACNAALAPQAGIGAGVRAGRRLLRELRPCARRPRPVDVGLKVSRRAAEIASRPFSRRAPKKRPVGGGAIVAIVGGDGAGKSTAVEAITERLGKTFAVTQAHLGKPDPSFSSRLVGNLARGRSAVLKLTRALGSKRSPRRATEQSVLGLLLARDRFLAYRKARRLADEGVLVVCDRYPLPQLTQMDAPRVERVRDPNRLRRLTDVLAGRERRYYDAIGPPDILVVLLVDTEIAVERSGDSPERVRTRWAELRSVDWTAASAHVVDAGQSREDVLAEIEAHVWSRLRPQ